MIALIITIAIVGLLVWLICTYVPMPRGYKIAIQVVAVVCIVIYLIKVFGLLDHDIPIQKL